MNELRQYFFRGKQTVITYESDASVSSSSFDQWFGSATSSFKLYEIKDGVKSVKTPTNLKCVKVSGVNAIMTGVQSDGSGGYKVTLSSEVGGVFEIQWQCDELKSNIFSITVNPRSQIIDTGDCVLEWAAGSKGAKGYCTAGKNTFGWKPPQGHLGSMTTTLIHGKQISGIQISHIPSGYSQRCQVRLKLMGNAKYNTDKIRLSFPDIPSGKTGWIIYWGGHLTEGNHYYVLNNEGSIIDFVEFIKANNKKSWKFKVDLL